MKKKVYTDKYKRLQRNIKSINRRVEILNDIGSHYWSYAELYKSVNKLTISTAFDHPYKNFLIFEGGLYHNQNSKVNFLDVKKAFNFLPHSESLELETMLITYLFKLLKYKPKSPINYDTIVKDYFFLYNPVTSTDLFISPWKYFVLYNNNLWYKNFESTKIDNDLPLLMLVNALCFSLVIKSFDLPLPTKSTIIKMLKLMKVKYMSQFQKLDIPGDVIFYDINELFYKTSYSPLKGAYIRIKFDNYNFLYKSTTLPKINVSDFLDSEVINYLYTLTNGSTQLLNQFACLVTDILTLNKIHKKLNIIVAKAAVKDSLQALINWIACDELLDNDISLKLFTKQNKLVDFIHYKSEALKGVIIDKHNALTDNEIRLLKRIISGKEIIVKDKSYGNLTFVNDYALITITNNHKHIMQYENAFNTNTINFNHLKNLPTITKINELYLFLCVPLALHGLNIISQRNKIVPEKANRKLIKDQITFEFYKRFCILKKDGEVYRSDLYQAYLAYYTRKYGDMPLTDIKFTKSIKTILINERNPENFQYKRPHHSKSQSNEWAFTGIELNTEELNKFIDSHEDMMPSNDFQTFSKYLSEINKLIPAEFSTNTDYEAIP